MVGAAVLCVIISMTLQVPELSVTAYMVFFVSKESKFLTTVTGVVGVIGLTIGIGATLLLYKFTYGHPELRIPGMAIALFLGMYCHAFLCSGHLDSLSALLSLSRNRSEKQIPSPELLVRGLLWLWVAIAYGVATHRRAELVVFAGHAEGRRTSAETEKFFCAGRVHQSRTRAFRPQSHFRSDVLLHRL